MLCQFDGVPEVEFGIGSIQNMVDKLARYQVKKVLLLIDPVLEQSKDVHEAIHRLRRNEIEIDIANEVDPEPSVEVIDHLVSILGHHTYDVYIGIGGGSVLNLTKILAVIDTNHEKFTTFIGENNIKNKGKPTIVIPTIVGSGNIAASNSLYFTNVHRKKEIIASPFLLPNLAIIDLTLSMNCPPFITASSAMNALSQAIESYILKGSNKVIESIALEAIHIISKHLFKTVYDKTDMVARKNMAQGTFLAGIAFNQVHFSLMEMLSIPVETRLGVDHGVASAILLPYVLEYYLTYQNVSSRKLAEALGLKSDCITSEVNQKIILHIKEMLSGLGFPFSLHHFGMTPFDVTPMAEAALEQSLQSEPISLADVKSIYRKVYDGTDDWTDYSYVKESQNRGY